MKKYFFVQLSIFILISSSSFSQNEYSTGFMKGIISTKTSGGDIVESTVVVFIKNNFLKTQVISNSNSSISILHSDTLTTLTEIMGKKMGFKIIDSLHHVNKDFNIIFLDTAKFINGFNCKKAIIQYTMKNHPTNDVEVWYTQDKIFKSKKIGINILGLENINGTPIQLETSTKMGMKIRYDISILTAPFDIKDEEFKIPSEYEIFTLEKYKQMLLRLSSGN